MAIGTGNISLQDVINDPDFAPTVDGNGDYTLDRCFFLSKSFGFDPTYGYVYSTDRSGNSLFNFKGYDHTLTQSVSMYDSFNNLLPGTFYTISDSFAPTSSLGATYQFKITTNGRWYLTRPVFASISPTSEQPSGTNILITITIQPQPVGGTARTGSVRVFGEDGFQVFRFDIYQEAYNAP